MPIFYNYNNGPFNPIPTAEGGGLQCPPPVFCDNLKSIGLRLLKFLTFLTINTCPSLQAQSLAFIPITA